MMVLLPANFFQYYLYTFGSAIIFAVIERMLEKSRYQSGSQ